MRDSAAKTKELNGQDALCSHDSSAQLENKSEPLRNGKCTEEAQVYVCHGVKNLGKHQRIRLRHVL